MESYTKVSKSSMAEILDQSSCAICHSMIRNSYGGLCLAPCVSDSANQIQKPQCKVYSTACESLEMGKEKQLGHGSDNTLNHVKGKEEKVAAIHDKIHSNGKYGPQHCSSLYDGGPDEFYDEEETRREDQNEVTMAVKQLENAMNPFYHECTTRGNWWQGSLYY